MEILGFSLEFVLLDASWCARVARPLYGVGRITKPSYTGKGGRLGLEKCPKHVAPERRVELLRTSKVNSVSEMARSWERVDMTGSLRSLINNYNS